MKIYDTFLYNNEFNLLLLRLKLLNPIVDYFIICESSFSIMGKYRIINLSLNDPELILYRKKIIHLNYSGAISENPWINENNQRNHIHKCINFELKDIIIHSDLDEIPNPKILSRCIKKLSDSNNNSIFNLSLENYTYNINFKLKSPFFTLHNGIKIFRANLLTTSPKMEFVPNSRNLAIKDNLFSFSVIRYYADVTTILSAGWHFTNFFGIHELRNKIKSFAHDELFISRNIDEMSNELLDFIITYGHPIESIKSYKLSDYNNLSKSILFLNNNIPRLTPHTISMSKITPQNKKILIDRIFYLLLKVFNLFWYKLYLNIRKVFIRLKLHRI
jgi:hypothetical protein